MLIILKFGTNVGHDSLYCVKENQHAAAYQTPYLSIFILSKQFVCYKCLSFYERNDITTLAFYDRHGSDSILSPQCNS